MFVIQNKKTRRDKLMDRRDKSVIVKVFYRVS